MTQTVKHTGPYENLQVLGNPEDDIEFPRVICSGPNWHETAKLMRTAPETAAERDRLKALNSELLAVLKEVRSFLSASLADDGRYDPCAETLKTVNTAIAKAEGR